MKLKLLLAILLLPLTAMAVQTNVFDNVLIRNNFQFTGGTPGLNKVLTSDATGKYTPQSLIALDATIVTNVASASLTVTGQGTHTLTIETPLINANTITNIVGVPLIAFTGQGTKVFTIAPDFSSTGIVTNGSSASLLNLTVAGTNGIGIAATSALAKFHVVVTNVTVAATPLMLLDEYGSASGAYFIGRRANGTVGSPTAVQTDDSLVSLNGRGYGATAFSSGRVIMSCMANENWTDTAQGTRWSIFTTSNGTAVANEAMTITDAGNLGLGITNAQTRLHVNGGATFKIAVTTTNYFSSSTDNIVLVKGSSATQVTNFLPAISTVITNGFMLTVSDEQMGAGTTNIVILPNGSDTVNLSTNKYINVNGGSIDLVVDAVNKNWKIK